MVTTDTRAPVMLLVALATHVSMYAERTVHLIFNTTPTAFKLSLSATTHSKSLFTFPPLRPSESRFVDIFFNTDRTVFTFDSHAKTQQFAHSEPQKKHATTTPSYFTMVDQITLPEAYAILRHQPYVTQAQNYMLQTLWKKDPIAHAQVLLRKALEDFNNKIKAVLFDYKGVIKKNIDRVIDLDNKKDPAVPFVQFLYNAVRDFGQAIGFTMPSLDKAWYVRHRGKLALGAGLLAILTFAHYNNAFGSRDTPAPQATTPAAIQTSTTPQSWYAQAKSTALKNIYDTAYKIGAAGNKEVRTAIIRRLKYKYGQEPTLGNVTFTQKVADVAGLELLKEVASAYGQKLVPDTPPATLLSNNPNALTTPIKSWLSSLSIKSWIANQWDTARTESFKKTLGSGVLTKAFAEL